MIAYADYLIANFINTAIIRLPWVIGITSEKDYYKDIFPAVQTARNLFGQDAYPKVMDNMVDGKWTFIAEKPGATSTKYLFFFQNELDEFIFKLSTDEPFRFQRYNPINNNYGDKVS